MEIGSHRIRLIQCHLVVQRNKERDVKVKRKMKYIELHDGITSAPVMEEEFTEH